MQNDGQSVAVYEPKDKKAFDECYRLVVESKRADVMCPADYSEDSQLYLSLSKMVEKISENITSDIENSKSKGLIKSPEHLN